MLGFSGSIAVEWLVNSRKLPILASQESTEDFTFRTSFGPGLRLLSAVILCGGDFFFPSLISSEI